MPPVGFELKIQARELPQNDALDHAVTGIGKPDSSVNIVTAFVLDGPGIESRWGEIFRTRPDRL
jgi:hypothetical protein